MAARKNWRPPILATEKTRAWIEARRDAIARGEEVEWMSKRDMRYRVKQAALFAGRKLAEASRKPREWGREKAIGSPTQRKNVHAQIDGNFDRIVASMGLTAADLRVRVEAKGHQSGPNGEVLPYVPGEGFADEVVLIVEKRDTMQPLAESLCRRGVKVFNTEGQSSGYLREDLVRWRAAGKRVFVLTDEDLGGHDIAAPLVAHGAVRVRLSELEREAGAPLGEEFLEEDLSYIKQSDPAKRLTAADNQVLLELGKRMGFSGPGAASLNSQRFAWGNRRYGELVGRAMEKRLGRPLNGGPARPSPGPDSDLI